MFKSKPTIHNIIKQQTTGQTFCIKSSLSGENQAFQVIRALSPKPVELCMTVKVPANWVCSWDRIANQLLLFQRSVLGEAYDILQTNVLKYFCIRKTIEANVYCLLVNINLTDSRTWNLVNTWTFVFASSVLIPLCIQLF